MPHASKPRQVQFGALDAIEIPRGQQATIVMLHGYGANMNDLLQLGLMIRNVPDARWIFPNAPLSLPSPMADQSRAWFPIDETKLEEAIITGKPRDFRDLRPPGMDDARFMLADAIDALPSNSGPLILAGFSQGAMLTLHLALSLEKPPAGILLWSGSLVDEAWLTARLQASKPIPYLQSHGRTDPIVGFNYAFQLHELLQAARWPGEFIAFDGPHTIPMDIVDLSEQFIARQIASASK